MQGAWGFSTGLRPTKTPVQKCEIILGCQNDVPAMLSSMFYSRFSLFLIQLHVRGFSSQRITSMIHFLSSVWKTSVLWKSFLWNSGVWKNCMWRSGVWQCRAWKCWAQCHECHACHAKTRWMRPSATPATQMERRCHQVPRLPRKVPRCPGRLTAPRRATRPSPVPEVPRLPRQTQVDVSKCHACHASATPATQVPHLPRRTQVDGVWQCCVQRRRRSGIEPHRKMWGKSTI